MSDLRDREKALEEAFFAKQNAKLLERMRAEKEKAASREGLARLSGIADAEVLDKLIELSISPETWAALSIVPMVEVAWADGSIDAKERRAILAEAEANGVARRSPSHELLDAWLRERPDGRLLEGWGEYIVALCAQLSPSERASLEREVLGRARRVAEVSGGLLGLTNKVSPAEERVLHALAKAFEG